MQPLTKHRPKSKAPSPQADAVPERSISRPISTEEMEPSVGLPLFLQRSSLRVSHPTDADEIEAERVAGEVMRMPDPLSQTLHRCACGGIAGPDGECAACKAKRLELQRKSDAAEGTVAPLSVHQTLRSSGQPLDTGTRRFMESRFGQDFSGIRVHTDSQAAQSAADVSASAYTTDGHIVFGGGKYAPGTPTGDRLIAHELTHVVQQASGEKQVQRNGTSRAELSALRTIAQGYIGDYFSAATSGVTNFERDVQSNFDWTAFWVNVSGNLIWATAAFATGGTAFLISVGGIALSTYASASTVTSAPDFHREATNRINAVVTHLNNQVDRVTRDVDSAAAAGNWDDNRTRMELLQRLLDPQRPEFILTATGGLPNLNQPAVAASVEEQLLIQASQTSGTRGVGRLQYGPGYFEEIWRVQGAIEYIEYPFSPVMPHLTDPTRWFYGLDRAQFVNVLPEVSGINTAINNIYRTYNRPVMPIRWPIRKDLVLIGERPLYIRYIFDSNNQLSRYEAQSFAAMLNAQGYNADRYIRGLLRLIQEHSHSTFPNAPQLTP